MNTSTIDQWIYWTGMLLILGLVGILINLVVLGDQLADYRVPLSLKIPLFLNALGGLAAIYFPIALFKIWQSTSSRMHLKIWNSVLILAIVIIVVGHAIYNVMWFKY